MFAGLHSGDDAGGVVFRRDRGSRNGSAAAVEDRSNDVTAGGLTGCDKAAAEQNGNYECDCKNCFLKPER